jgi:transcriptional regulator with XRE-family HTH domain
MIALKEHLAGTGLSQRQIAKLFGVSHPRVSDLMRGKIDVFGLDALVNMAAAAAGLRVKLSVRKAARSSSGANRTDWGRSAQASAAIRKQAGLR